VSRVVLSCRTSLGCKQRLLHLPQEFRGSPPWRTIEQLGIDQLEASLLLISSHWWWTEDDGLLQFDDMAAAKGGRVVDECLIECGEGVGFLGRGKMQGVREVQSGTVPLDRKE
jgi:hypothetical protein